MLHFSDVLTDAQYKYVIDKTLNAREWHFDSVSNLTNNWKLDLDNDNFFTQTFVQIIEKFSIKKFNLERVYANGRTFGQCGNFRQDNTEPNTYTFVYYVNNCDGDTFFYDELYTEWNNYNKRTLIKRFTPTKGTGVLFNGHRYHGNGVGRLHNRIVINMNLTLE
jgi:hypothetical protein